MKILMVNKFLYPNGGSETYMLKLGEYFTDLGHEIQYFGMLDDRNTVGNTAKSYTSNMEFRSGKKSKFSKITYPFKIIYSIEARKKIKIVLEDFKPDVVHMNNINYQLTPSIIYEIQKCGIPMVQTVHDAQMACPNHRLYIEKTGEICEKCVSGSYINCLKTKCMQGSTVKSLIATIESYYYHIKNTYNMVDRYVCPSKFIAEKIKQSGVNDNRITVMYNFSDPIPELPEKLDIEPYILYFGRLSQEKGISTLISVCRQLQNIKFIFAGTGPLADELKGISNIEFVGFKSGKELQSLIRNAAFSIYPSEWYENCPLSVIESQALGTPVIGSDLGGIKELIDHKQTGFIFKGRNAEKLKCAIVELWENSELRAHMENACFKKKSNTINVYSNQLLALYQNLILDYSLKNKNSKSRYY